MPSCSTNYSRWTEDNESFPSHLYTFYCKFAQFISLIPERTPLCLAKNPKIIIIEIYCQQFVIVSSSKYRSVQRPWSSLYHFAHAALFFSASINLGLVHLSDYSNLVNWVLREICLIVVIKLWMVWRPCHKTCQHADDNFTRSEIRITICSPHLKDRRRASLDKRDILVNNNCSNTSDRNPGGHWTSNVSK